MRSPAVVLAAFLWIALIGDDPLVDPWSPALLDPWDEPTTEPEVLDPWVAADATSPVA